MEKSSTFSNKYRIDSTRWQNWDYREVGFYFVTVCTKDKWPLFGTIRNGIVTKNYYGEICESCWKQIPEHFSNCQIDSFVVMPDHFHGIVVIKKKTEKSLFDVIRSFKCSVTKICNENYDGLNSFAWQSRYYDRVIRSNCELLAVRKYIELNPVRVETDESLSRILENINKYETDSRLSLQNLSSQYEK
jgi:REP element-mobilizing transposase RayT